MKESTEAKHENHQARFQRLFENLLKAAQLVLEGHPDKEKLYLNFIKGIVLVELDRKTGKKANVNKAELLTKPVFDLIFNYIRTDEYRQTIVEKEVSGDEVFEIDLGTSPKTKIKIPITQKKVLDQIKYEDAFVLLPKDVRSVLSNLFNIYTERYTVPIQVKDTHKDTKFEELFREPDSIPTSKKVKEIVNAMNLFFNRENNTKYKNKFGDEVNTYKNALAFVFAALRDPENGICAIKHGVIGHQLFTFCGEFGLIVSEKKDSGDVTRRNLMEVLKSPNRFQNIIYLEFTKNFTK